MNKMLMKCLIAVVVAAGALIGAPLVAAQGMTADQATEMLNELKQIRQLLEKQVPPPPPPPPDEKVNIEFPTNGYSMGKADAPLVFVEYTDFECPFCQRYHLDAFEQVKKEWVDTGKMRYYSRDFPLEFHPNARRAALAARCAGDQGKYWELRNTMIKNADQLAADRISTYASTVGLDVKKFEACLGSDFYKPAIDKDIAEGNNAGVTGTPSFVVGRVDKGRLIGLRLVGAMPYPRSRPRFARCSTSRHSDHLAARRDGCQDAESPFQRAAVAIKPPGRGTSMSRHAAGA
jgi:protein-disulfide isomerase